MKYTKESEDLQSFIDVELNRIPIEHLTKSSQRALLPIYKLMRVANDEFSNTMLSKNYYIKSDTSSIPVEIQPLIGECSHIQSVMFKIKHRTIYLNIFSPTSTLVMSKYAKRIYMWLYIASHYACFKCSKTMNINLYLTKHTKIIPNIGSAIGRSNVNTAYTTLCSDTTDICIYREQEYFKVFIHETFHNLGLDFSSMQHTNADARIGKMFKVDADIRLYEAYCETWAEIINAMFVSFFSTKIKNNFGIMMGKLDNMLQTESRFSLFQCAKVLNCNNMMYTDLFNESKRRYYREDSYVLSYYIIKSILLYNKNQFIEWCVSNNKVLLDFNKTVEGVNSFCNLIRSLYMDMIYINAIKTNETWFIHNRTSKLLARNTLRMTVIEMEN
jgi:hypothetical protein